MIEAAGQDGGGLSLLPLATLMLRERRLVARWMFIGAALATLSVAFKPAVYLASASFAPQGSDVGRAGLASLAGQFGVSLPSGNQSLSPEFYSRLLQSRMLLLQVARDTFVVLEKGGSRVSFLDLLKIRGGTAARREEKAVSLLRGIVLSSVVKATGVVELSVATQWPSVSLAIATTLVNGVNEFNLRVRQGQAAAERRFVETRLALAGRDLRAAEDGLEHFLRTNRQYASSPELSFQEQRLQRDVTLEQQVFTSLTQSYEEVRIREVRDTPVITVIEPTSVGTLPQPRGRLMGVFVGALLGALMGAVVVVVSAAMARLREQGDAEAEELVRTLADMKGEVRRYLRLPRARRRS